MLLRQEHECFARLVRSNFPTLADHLLEGDPLPTICLYAVNVFGPHTTLMRWQCAVTEPGFAVQKVDLEEVVADETSLTMGGRTYSVRSGSEQGYETGWPGSTSTAYLPVKADSHFCPLRSLVYGRLWSRLPEALESLAERYGVGREHRRIPILFSEPW